jgi:hypothetical protein
VRNDAAIAREGSKAAAGERSARLLSATRSSCAMRIDRKTSDSIRRRNACGRSGDRERCRRRRHARLGRCLAAHAHAAAPIAVRAISRAHHRGAVVAVWPMASHHRATWSDAPRVIATGGARGRVGLRDLDGEQAKGQQARNNCFHRYLPERVSSRAWGAGATPACQVKRARCRLAKSEFRYFPPAPALAIASLQPSLRSAACDFMHSPTVPLPGLTSAQSFLASALQALPTAVARMIAT